MPIYTYQCPVGHSWDKMCSIDEMTKFEQDPQQCVCGRVVARVLVPPRRHVTFKAGFYEHISPDGAHVETMGELRRIAKENGNYSVYAEDLGGLFKAKEGRWI